MALIGIIGSLCVTLYTSRHFALPIALTLLDKSVMFLMHLSVVLLGVLRTVFLGEQHIAIAFDGGQVLNRHMMVSVAYVGHRCFCLPPMFRANAGAATVSQKF